MFVYGLEKVCVTCSHSDTGLLEQTDMDTFLASGVPPKSNAFIAWDLSLLNSLKDKRHAQTLSPPPSLSLFILQPVAFTEGSYLTRKLHCSRHSIVSHQVEMSFFCLKLYCVLLYWFCVWACLYFQSNEKFMLGAPLSRPFCLLYIGTRFVPDNWWKNSTQIKWESLWLYMSLQLFIHTSMAI